jgi:hypothetical protein
MKHARSDYDRIQDPAGLIPENEPVLLFRAQDKHFIKVARFYQMLVEEDDDGDMRIVTAIDDHLVRARNWPVRKTPDMPRSE